MPDMIQGVLYFRKYRAGAQYKGNKTGNCCEGGATVYRSILNDLLYLLCGITADQIRELLHNNSLSGLLLPENVCKENNYKQHRSHGKKCAIGEGCALLWDFISR